MRSLWKIMKQRIFEQSSDYSKPKSNPDGDDAEPSPTIATMPKKEQMNMIRMLFKTMVHGVSTDRFKILMAEAMKRPFEADKAPKNDGSAKN